MLGGGGPGSILHRWALGGLSGLDSQHKLGDLEKAHEQTIEKQREVLQAVCAEKANQLCAYEGIRQAVKSVAVAVKSFEDSFVYHVDVKPDGRLTGSVEDYVSFQVKTDVAAEETFTLSIKQLATNDSSVACDNETVGCCGSTTDALGLDGKLELYLADAPAFEDRVFVPIRPDMTIDGICHAINGETGKESISASVRRVNDGSDSRYILLLRCIPTGISLKIGDDKEGNLCEALNIKSSDKGIEQLGSLCLVDDYRNRNKSNVIADVIPGISWCLKGVTPEASSVNAVPFAFYCEVKRHASSVVKLLAQCCEALNSYRLMHAQCCAPGPNPQEPGKGAGLLYQHRTELQRVSGLLDEVLIGTVPTGYDRKSPSLFYCGEIGVNFHLSQMKVLSFNQTTFDHIWAQRSEDVILFLKGFLGNLNAALKKSVSDSPIEREFGLLDWGLKKLKMKNQEKDRCQEKLRDMEKRRDKDVQDVKKYLIKKEKDRYLDSFFK
eukprot:GHVR01095120.1.p1 GENE.GHVR01095120.1~~GHVR01095120.1.p1  ORF type:complete len:495 (-),score=56.21 GHVR01095120.1:413-1897(-)